MFVASLELSKQLYEVSGWDDTHWVLVTWWNSKSKSKKDAIRSIINNTEMYHNKSHFWHEIYKFDNPVFQYDLGYLLRRTYELGPTIGFNLEARPDTHNDRKRYFALIFQDKIDIRIWSDTPENATCLLAIELFNQGILKKGA